MDTKQLSDRLKYFLSAWGMNGVGSTVAKVQDSPDTVATLTVNDLSTLLSVIEPDDPVAPAAEPQNEELASMTRMFHAACADLGAINEALGLDPDDGGAEPILDAIAELKRERDQWVDANYAAAAAQPDERAAFEAWMLTGDLDLKPNLERDGEFYDDFNTQRAWRGWQARATTPNPVAVAGITKTLRLKDSRINEIVNHACYSEAGEFMGKAKVATRVDVENAIREALREAAAYAAECDGECAEVVGKDFWYLLTPKEVVAGSAGQAAAVGDGTGIALPQCTNTEKVGSPVADWRADIQKVIDSLEPDDWCGDESMIDALNRALSATPTLDMGQREAVEEAIAWAVDDGLPGTAEMLRSILAAPIAAPTEGSAGQASETEANARRYLQLRALMVQTEPPISQGHIGGASLDAVLDAAAIAAPNEGSAGKAPYGYVLRKDFEKGSSTTVGKKVLEDDVPLYAAPIAALTTDAGAVTDEQLDAIWDSVPWTDLNPQSLDHVSTLRRRFGRALLAAHPERMSAAARDVWQPIETAPKTGRTLLLGYLNSAGKWRTVRGQWMSEAYIAEHWEEPDDVEPGWFETSVEADDVPNCWRVEPTHWMLLPAAPDAARAAEIERNDGAGESA